MKTAEQIQKIETRAQRIGVSMPDLCKEAGVHISTINRWKRKSTDPLKKIHALEKALRHREGFE